MKKRLLALVLCAVLTVAFCTSALAATSDENKATLMAALKQTVPTYHDPEEVNCTADQAEEMRIAQAAE